MKRLILFLISFLVIFSLAACEDDSEEKLRVMIICSEGATVIGDNPVEVNIGDDVRFEIEIDPEYYFDSVSNGEYDTETGILTIENVEARMNVSFYTQKSNFDTTVTVPFLLKGEEGDSSNIDKNEIPLGTLVKVKSANQDKIFLGWSFEKAFSAGGVIVSEEREFEFIVTPEILRNEVMYVYANYLDNISRVMYYDANGGIIDDDSDNIFTSKYYNTIVSENRVRVTLKDNYFSYSSAFSAFYDDGTFTRDGYVLVEYNTKPDGSGESYSLGSKFYAENKNDIETLYCIWKKDSNHADFVYEDYEYKCPVKSEYAPEWQNTGVIITEYRGNDACVVIPEKLDGKYVIAIAEGAFVGKHFDTLVLNKRIQLIEDGAFRECSSLETLYYPDGLYSISNDAFDEATYKNFKNFYVNATIAPRYSNTADGAFSVKLSRLFETGNQKQIIFIGGSSVYEGLATEYLEALFDGEYKIVNFGTTRTTHGLIYLEAMKHFADSDDIVVYAPENSIYMMGERELYYKTLRDLEGMNNFYRYIDISNYTNVFSAFSDFNRNYRYKRAEAEYEAICELSDSVDKYGDMQNAKRAQLDYPYYQDIYAITLNERNNSKLNDPFSKTPQEGDPKDYKAPDNIHWVSIDNTEYTSLVNHSVSAAKSSGARVIFGYCPCDANAIVEEARNKAWLEAYEKLISELYDFDASLGTVSDYIYNHKYIYDSAFHLNDYGRTYRTYSVYCDLTELLSLGEARGIYSVGTDFAGCCFEENSDGTPNFKVDFLQ